MSHQVKAKYGSDLAGTLVQAGIDEQPDAFARAVHEALGLFSTAGDETSEISSLFTKAEARELGAGGLDLASARPVEHSARTETAALMAALLIDSLPVGAVAARLGVNHSRVRQLLIKRALFGIKVDREWRVPRFQFDGSRIRRGLSHVLSAMPPDLHPVEIVAWLSQPEPDLDLAGEPSTPLLWLETGGDPARAAHLARDL